MKLEAKEIRDAIAEGIESLLRRMIALNDQRNEDPRPEYLTTAAVAFALGDYVKKKSLHGLLRIRCEELTKHLWYKATIKWLFKKFPYLPRPTPNSDFRNGNVDISLFEVQGFERPFAVIENKGILKFGQDGELYADSYNEVHKDLKRNADFIVGLGAVDGVHYTAFTFYLRDEDSALTEHGDAYKAEKKRYFEKLVDGLHLDPTLKRNVLIETWDDGLLSSKEAALEEDEYGQPAIDAEGSWHLLYGIISIYQPGSVVLDGQSLSEL